jgi:hypothetical protein
MATAQYFAGGCSFHDFETLRVQQLNACFSASLKGIPPTPWRLQSSEAMYGDPNGWLPIPAHPFSWRMSEEQKQYLRTVRLRAYGDMASTFKHWKTHPERKLEDWKETELKPARSAYGELLQRRVAQVVASGSARDPRATMEAALEFVKSPAFGEVPFLKISSWLYAAAARKAVAQKNPPSPGFLGDVELIACLLHRPCRAYLNELQLTGRLTFDARVFSLANKAELIAFIDELERTAPSEQVLLADQLYGTN